ncbi:hypothetical protein MMC18_008810 [Xylographa bjoerkii]|nr:hypothetical protein [Xylographa bjoerkii]
MTYYNSVPSSATSITLSTSKFPSIQWMNGLDGVKIEELKELAFLCRTAMNALETELAERKGSQDDQRLEKQYSTILEANAEKINTSGTLSEEQNQQLKGSQSFVALLNGNAVLDQHELKNARDFVWLIATRFGWPIALLIICSLTKTKLRTMSDAHRVTILKYISKNNFYLYCEALHRKARELRFYDTKHLANRLIDLNFDKRKRRRKEISTSSRSDMSWRSVLETFQPPRSVAPPQLEAPTQPPLQPDTPLPDAPAPPQPWAPTQPPLQPDIPLPDAPAPPQPWAPTQPPLQPDTPLPNAPASLQPWAPQQHGQSTTYDLSRRFRDGLLSYTSSASSIDSISKSRTVVDQSIPSSDDTASTEASLQDKIRRVFSDLDHESKTLMKLFCFLDPTAIPELMLVRAEDCQTDWASTGEIERVSPTQAGLSTDVVSIVSAKDKIEKALDRLKASELITWKLGHIGRILSLDLTTQSLVAECITDPLRWKVQALLLVCHTFPMHRHFEPLFGNLGRLQVNQVQHIARNYHLLGPLLSSDIKYKVAAVFLAASYFLDISWKHEALKAVEAITVDELPSYLQTWANSRKCVVAGIESHNKLMDSVGRPISCNQADARTNAIFGQWVLNYSANQIKCGKLQRARLTLSELCPLNKSCISTMERLVFVKREVIEGKIDRFLGNFLNAREHLVHPAVVLDKVTACTRLSHLAAVYCELGQPEKAVKILGSEVQTIGVMGLRNQRHGRCLHLAFAEALLQQNRLEEAQSIYTEVRNDLGRISDTDMVTKMSKLRMWIGFARISHVKSNWSDALKLGKEALKAATECGWQEGFVEMIIHYSIGYAKRQLTIYAEYDIQKADQLLQRVGRQYWWTNLGTSWLDYVLEGLQRDIKGLRQL